MRRSVYSVALLNTVLIASAIAADAERKIKRSDLPAAIEGTVGRETKGATIRGFSQETEKGKTYYEVSLTVNGHGKDVLIDSSGQVVEIEEEVALGSLSTGVKKALQSKAGDGTIVTIESVTRGGHLVAYEAHLRRRAKTSEIQVGPNGEALVRE